MNKAFVAKVVIFSLIISFVLPAMELKAQDAAQRGTVFQVKLTKEIGSAINQPGDVIYAVANEPIVSGGRIIFPAGTEVIGVVNEAKPARGGQSNGELNIVFNKLRTKEGREVRIVANLEGYSEFHENSWRKRLLTLAIAMGASAIISKIFGGSLARGLMIGGAAGAGYILYSDGNDVHLPAGTTINLVLEESVSVGYSTSQREERPVYTDEDYRNKIEKKDSDYLEEVTPDTENRQEGVIRENRNDAPYKLEEKIKVRKECALVFADGKNEIGTFVGLDDAGKILIDKQYGVLQIPVEKIREIIFDSKIAPRGAMTNDSIVLISGNVFNGFLSGFWNGKIVFSTDYGELKVPVNDIAKIVLNR